MALFSTYAKIQQTNGFHRYLLDFFHKQDDKPGYVLNNQKYVFSLNLLHVCY